MSANAGPIETKKILNSFEIVRLSFTVSLLIVNLIFLFELHEFFPIMDFNIFHEFFCHFYVSLIDCYSK